MRQAEVKIILDSVNDRGVRLTTFQLRYQRFIHSEFMTHRVFSRNASSSRAVPAKKIWDQIMTAPAMPFEWGMNQAGMQAKELASPEVEAKAIEVWRNAAADAVKWAQEMDALGLHKQIVNRITEPFSFIQVVVSATEWENFFALRDHPDADPSFHDMADMMRDIYTNGPVPVHLAKGDFHLPYVLQNEDYPIEALVAFSVARCARVSYILHDGTPTNPQKDMELYERLALAQPPHMSPFEHQARPSNSWDNYGFNGNFNPAWCQYRKFLERGTPENFWRTT